MRILILTAIIMFGISFYGAGADRFPRPDFNETHHQLPVVQHAKARLAVFEYLDVAVLCLCLILAVAALKRRSRKTLSLLAFFSVLYFGFYKQGCICSVGSLQNMALTVCSNDYFMPLTAVLFFSCRWFPPSFSAESSAPPYAPLARCRRPS